MIKTLKTLFVLIIICFASIAFNFSVASKLGVNSIYYIFFSFSGMNAKFISLIKKEVNVSKKILKEIETNKIPVETLNSDSDTANRNVNLNQTENNELNQINTEINENIINEQEVLAVEQSINTKIADVQENNSLDDPDINTMQLDSSLSLNNEVTEPSKNNIEKKEYEKDDTYLKYEFLSMEDFGELVKKSSLSEDIIKLSSNSSSLEREEHLKKMFLKPKETILELIPFLRSSDKVLVLNSAELLSIFNCKEAVPELINRFNYENDDFLKEKLIKFIGSIEDSKAYSFLNDVFIKTDSISLMSQITDFIYEYPDISALEKAQNLIETSADIHLKTILHKFYFPTDKVKALDFAKTWIATHDARLDLICLSILMLSDRIEDWEYIDKYKRAFFKSVDLMEAFFKAKSCVVTSNLKGSKRYDAMEEIFSSNKLLLAWLSLYSAKKHENESIEWVKSFSNKYNLLEYSDFIRSHYILDIPLPDIKTVSENEIKTNALKEIKTAELQQNKPKEEEKILPKCKITFDSLPEGAKVFNGKNELQLNEEFCAELPLGQHKIKIFIGNESSNILNINAIKDASFKINIKKFEKPETINVTGEIIMKFIPKGEFTMGSSALNLKEHLVKLTKDIYVSIYEVTNKQYENYKTDNKNKRDKRSDKDNQPVIMVNWYDAVNFCNWLSEKERLLPAYDENCVFKENANGYRLLTEAEWEYCARGGFSGKTYPWGNEEVNNNLYFANYYPRGGKELDGHIYTSPVGSYSENGFGLFDMAGNVSEWCNDWYEDNYYNSFNSEIFTENPFGPSSGSLRVTRGASWQTRDGLKCAYRSGSHPMDKSNYRGFRIAKNMPNFFEYEITIAS